MMHNLPVQGWESDEGTESNERSGGMNGYVCLKQGIFSHH